MRINQEIRSTKSKANERYLIVAISLDGLEVALSDLTCKSPRKPISLAIDAVYENIKNKEWEIIEHYFPEHLFCPDSELDEKWKEKRDKAKRCIGTLVDNDELVEEYIFRSPDGILADLIKNSGKSKSYIHNMLGRWFRGGSMENALLPHYINCGNSHQLPPEPIIKDDGSVCLASKPGKKTKYGAPYRAVTQQDIKKIEAFSRTIPSGSNVDLMDLYTKFVLKFMSFKFAPKSTSSEEEVHEEAIPFPRQHLISPRSFRYFLNTFIDKLEWIKTRVGPVDYDRNHKGKPGSARAGLRSAGQRYEIDATIADVYIKYPYSNKELLSCGRPVIYFVIDTYSGMIVGFHISFDGPNWNGASQALFNAFENKVEFCRRWGVEINESDWPCDFICSEIVWDRGGENSDNNLASVLKGRIGIKIMKLVAFHRGDCKGTVEKTFDIVISKAVKFDPGKVEKYPIKENQHSSRKPFLEFEDFMRKIIMIIIHNNNFSRKEAHNFHMESMNIGYTPRDIWNHFMNQTILKPSISRDLMRFALMPEAEATVTDKGVLFEGLYFSCPKIEKLLWLDQAKNFGRYKIKIRYSDVTTNHIWFYDVENKELIKLDLQDRCEAYKNQIWANVFHRLEIRKHELARQDQARFSNKLLLELDLSEMDKEIKTRNKSLRKSEAKNTAPGTKKRQDTVIAAQRNRQSDELLEDMHTQSQQPDSSETKADDRLIQDLTDPTVIY